MTNEPKLFLSKIPKLFRIEIGSLNKSIKVKWVDFDLTALDIDYPRVNHFLFRPTQPDLLDFSVKDPERTMQLSLFALPLTAVEEVDWSSGWLRVVDPESIHELDPETSSSAVLLVRDVLDAYIIDLHNRRLMRANDLLLEDSQGLRLKAADTGMRALLRRLSGDLYKGFRDKELLDWKYVEFLRGDPDAVRSGAGYHRRIAQLQPGDIAHLVEGLPYLHAAEEIMLLPHQLAADTLELMTSERQLQVFEDLDEAYALPILEKIAPDVAADLMGRLTPSQARHYLNHLPKLYSERIIDLLRYPERSVGGIMTNDMVALPGDLSVAEARQRLRKDLHGPDFVYFIYVVNNDEDLLLRGVVTLRDILVAEDDQRIEEIMNTYLESLNPLDSSKKGAFQLIQSQLAALPVVAPNGRLLGVVTVDVAVRQVAPGTWSTQAPRIFS